MEKKYTKKKSGYTFREKKDWIWLLALVLGIGVVVAALCLDYSGKICVTSEWWSGIRHQLWLASGTVCDLVIAYSTMLAAIVIFFYSVIDNKRLGIPYRRLIFYTIGSHTIPVLFMLTLLVTVLMVIAHHMPWKRTMYACVIYILAIQIFVIIEILRSTSYEHCKKVICNVEKKKYLAGAYVRENYGTKWIYSAGHLEYAVHSEEFFSDKKELMAEFLWIPFERCTGELCQESSREEVLTEAEEQERLYQFYFLNIVSAFRKFDGDANYLERNEFYTCIVDFLRELFDKLSVCGNIKNDREMKYIYHMVLSGIMNGVLFSNVEDGPVFCDYIFSRGIPDSELSMQQLRLFVLFREVLNMFEEDTTPGNMRIKKLAEWRPIGRDGEGSRDNGKEDDITLCAYFWEVWTRMFEVSPVKKMRHFEAAMQTMSGRGNASAVISEMLLMMTEKG